MKSQALFGFFQNTVNPVKNGHSQKEQKNVFQDQLSLNVPRGEHSAILLTFIKQPFLIKIVVLSLFEWPLKTGFTVCRLLQGFDGVLKLHNLIITIICFFIICSGCYIRLLC